MRLLLKLVPLSCLLVFLVGCPGSQQRVQTRYSSVNLTMTCIHNSLSALDEITKAWIFYDQDPIYRSQSLVSGQARDGVGFEGEGFMGQVMLQEQPVSRERAVADIYIYTKDLYWGFRDKTKFVSQIEYMELRIKEALIEDCK